MEGGATGQYTEEHQRYLRADSMLGGFSGWTDVVRDTSKHDASTLPKHLMFTVNKFLTHSGFKGSSVWLVFWCHVVLTSGYMKSFDWSR